MLEKWFLVRERDDFQTLLLIGTKLRSYKLPMLQLFYTDATGFLHRQSEWLNVSLCCVFPSWVHFTPAVSWQVMSKNFLWHLKCNYIYVFVSEKRTAVCDRDDQALSSWVSLGTDCILIRWLAFAPNSQEISGLLSACHNSGSWERAQHRIWRRAAQFSPCNPHSSF